jgi:hypothetical protein
MKKIKILIVIFLLSDAVLMHGMTTTAKTGGRRMLPAGKTLLQQPIQPRFIQTISPNIPSPQSEIKRTTPFLNQKKLLSGVTIAAARAKIAQAGQYVRNWFNSLMTSWFSAQTAKPVVVAPVENAPSPFVTGIQKGQYSAVAERQPVEEKASMGKSAVQMESEEIIKQLDAGRYDERLFEQIKTFFVKNNVDDVENVFMKLVNRYYLDFLGREDSMLTKIESLKQRWFEKMGWFNGVDIGDVLLDYGNTALSLLPADTDSFIDIADKIFQADLPVRQGYRAMDVIERSQNLKDALMDSVWNKIMHEHDEKKREKLCELLIKNYKGRYGVKLATPMHNPDSRRALISAFKNMLSKGMVVSYELASYFLALEFSSDPALAEDLGTFIFMQLQAKSKKTVGLDRQESDLLIDIVKIFFKRNRQLPEGLLEFIILNHEYAFSHFIEMMKHMSLEQAGNLRVKIDELLIPLLKKYKQAKSKGDIKGLKNFLNSSDVMEIIFDINNNLAQIPSYKHLQEYYGDLGGTFSFIMSDPYFAPMVQQIMSKEKELIDSGYEVFYHARRWQYGFLTDVYDMLYEYKSGKDLDDFMFTQLDDPVVGKVSDKFYASETEKRERLIKEGNPYDSKTNSFGISNRQSLLFLNKFLFGNLGRLGSCSMYYLLENHNMGEIAFSTQEIFNMFGLNDAYQAFADELKQLQQEHDNLSKYGEMLQIAVPKDNVDKSVYYTTSGGPKKEFVSTSGGEKVITTDIKTILTDLDKKPQDIAEFVLVETRDKLGGLNPESGIKVFSYNAVDPALWNAFKEKEKALFDRIQDWMRMRKKEQDKMARE